MSQFIVFTSADPNRNIYPNLIDADSLSDAVEAVLEARPGHRARAVSTDTLPEKGEVLSFVAISRLIPPKQDWRIGTYFEGNSL